MDNDLSGKLAALNVNAPTFVPNINAAAFVPTFLREPAGEAVQVNTAGKSSTCCQNVEKPNQVCFDLNAHPLKGLVSKSDSHS